MSDWILMDGDGVIFTPLFAPALVQVQPGKIVASGAASLAGSKVCVDGDEASVAVAGCSYMTPQFSIPGVGTLKIEALAADQKAHKTQSGGKPVLLLGGEFTAKFAVQSPAQQPPAGPGSPIPDSMSEYSGNGRFITANARFTGT